VGWKYPWVKKKKVVSGIDYSRYNFELPSDMVAFAYFPYGAPGRIEYWRHINISPSRFKRGGKDSEEKKTKERIDEGRDGRELHDDEWDIKMLQVDVDKDM
jgi:hypothetical protein